MFTRSILADGGVGRGLRQSRDFVVDMNPGCFAVRRTAVRLVLDLLMVPTLFRGILLLLSVLQKALGAKSGASRRNHCPMPSESATLASPQQRVLVKNPDAESIREVKLKTLLHLCQSAGFRLSVSFFG